MILFYVVQLNVFGQLTFYEDIFRGSVICLGSSSSDANGSFTQNTNLAINTSVKKFFLICYGEKGFHFVPTKKKFKINGQEFSLDTLSNTSLIVGNQCYIPQPADYHGHITYCIDLTQYFPVISSSIHLEWIYDALSDYVPVNCPSCHVSAPRIIILTEEPTLPPIVCSIQLNDQDNAPSLTVNTTTLAEADFLKPIALGIHTDRLGGNPIDDGYRFWLNNQYAGEIRTGEDFFSGINIGGSGALGNFMYNATNFSALTDDDIDPLFKGLSSPQKIADGLVTLNYYLINNNINPINFKIDYYGSSINQHNFFVSYTLAYSTPCQPFNVSVSNDTVVCPGEAVQLHASGGVQYEWLPHKNLSCYNCANPVFTGDSSQFYSVRIWNNDSCSVVRPVMVRVRPKPTFSNLSSSPSVCGGSTGSIVAVSPSASNYSLDNTAWQTSGSFSNLQAGNYTVYVTDTNGCVGDSTLSVTEQTTVHAQFTATPSTGTVPLSVVLNNQSSNYTHLEWFVDGVSQGANFSQFLAGQSGVYDIELVAWQNNSTCADTFSLQISAYDSLLISIPNIVTPNQDGINDLFSIHCNQPVNVTYSILNRWGNVISEGKLNKQQGNVVLWNISDEITDGLYFYKITFSSENPQIQQQLEQLGATKTGFVEVVR